MNTPDTIQTLFIRACKSKDPHTRVNSVYRRFYYSKGKIDDRHLVSIFIEIVEGFCPMSLTRVFDKLRPDDYFFEDDPYWTRAKKVLISHIRLSHKDCFGNMRVPLMFKK
jgi:hypothetical protein